MKTFFALGAVVILAGCAAPTYENLRSKASENTNDELCVVQLVKPSYAQVAADELASRGATCDWARASAQAQVYLARKQASDAAMTGAALQLMQSGQPRTYNSYQPSSTPVGVAPVGMYKGDRVNGWLRYCTYSNGIIKTVSSSELCPPTVN